MAIHLYGVISADAPPLDDLTGRQGTPLRLISDDRLAVIVSDVDAEVSVNHKDLLAHAHALESYVKQTTVIPMQFGIVLPDDDSVRHHVLEGDRASLLNLLKVFDGFLQFTINAFYEEEPALQEVLKRCPWLVSLRDQLRAFPEAADPSRQFKLGQAVAHALEELQKEDSATILHQLAPLAHDVADNRNNGPHEVANAAFLVKRTSQEAFSAGVVKLRNQLGARVRLRYVGPQPPYSFLEPVQAGELAWA